MTSIYASTIPHVSEEWPLTTNLNKTRLIKSLYGLKLFASSKRKNIIKIYYSKECQRAYAAARVCVFRTNKSTKPFIDLTIRSVQGTGAYTWSDIQSIIVWHMLHDKRVKNEPLELKSTYFEELKFNAPK